MTQQKNVTTADPESALRCLALHGLAVKKAGRPEAVAGVLGEDPETVAAALEQAVAAGHAISANGLFMVTPAGGEWLRTLYPQVFAEFRAASEVQEGYERFERINRELLALFTDWQMVPLGSERTPNDHSDAAYDAAIVDRLGALHDRAERPLAAFRAADARLGRYGERLDGAYDRVLAGEHEFVSAPKLDSYHTVWFELHEDLLRRLGRRREEQT